MDKSRSFERFKELDLSRDEIDRIGEALKKDEFRQLLVDYVKEVQDPENQRKYEMEMTQLEKERGNDITFLHPTPYYVIKTSIDGTKKCFVNVCGNDLVQKPYSTPSEKNGNKGLQWSLPHSMSPPSEDLDNKGERCQVFDVLFHPDTLHLAHKNKAFRNMVNSIACKAVETQFNVKLDKNNLKFPKLKYKGMARASVIRKPSAEGPVQRTPEEKEFFDKLYAQADNTKPVATKAKKIIEESDDFYTKPNFLIKQRRQVELEEFINHKESKLNTTIPKELIVEINLPLLKSANDIILDVTEKTVQLTSEKPAKYKLNLTLPYRVDQDQGNAKFDKDLKRLVITLPVKVLTSNILNDFKEDSGVDSDHGSPVEEIGIESVTSEFRTKFLNDEIHYVLPEFTCHVLDNTIAFTLNVKNVDADSVSKLIHDKSIHVKFVSVSPSYYNCHYAFMVELPVESIDKNSVSIEVWDNNVILQLSYKNCDKECTSYMYGIDQNDLQQKFIEEPHILNAIQELKAINEECEPKIEHKILECQDSIEEEYEDSVRNIATSCESSGDELSCSYSPKKNRGILKRNLMRKFSRSISESSLDDCAGSLDYESVDSAIPEDNEASVEMSTSLKKTVRFNDVVSKQLYRFNSSILGQKKKNQRKALKKKKAQERRHSESEASEIEDRNKERDHKTDDCDLKDSDKSGKRDENIFDLDM